MTFVVRNTCHRRRQRDVVEGIERSEEVEGLEDETDVAEPEPGQVGATQLSERPAIYSDLATRW